MKPIPFIVAVIFSIAPLILVVNLIFMGQKNTALAAQVQSQQQEISKGSTMQQIGVSLLKEIAAASIKDEKLKEVLAKSGYQVNVNASPSPAAAPAGMP